MIKAPDLKLKIPPLTAWSISRLLLWEDCPRKSYYKYVMKLDEQPGPAMVRGDEIHKAIEAYAKGRSDKLGKKDVGDKSILAMIKALRAKVQNGTAKAEYEIALDRKWKRIDWFAKTAYVRVKADAMELGNDHVAVLDWKTGKVNPSADYKDQLELNGLSAISANFGKTAHGELIFTDHGVRIGAPGDEHHRVIKLAEVPKLITKWDRRAAGMLADKTFRAKPAHRCNWCSYSRDKADGKLCVF